MHKTLDLSLMNRTNFKKNVIFGQNKIGKEQRGAPPVKDKNFQDEHTP